MTMEEKRSRVANDLDLRPSTAALAVEMLEKQKEFLAAIARSEYNRGVADVLAILEEEMLEENVSFKGGVIKERILALMEDKE